jgi:hypothetical protein
VQKVVCRGEILLNKCELITRVKCSAHQREEEFTGGGIFTRVASTAGFLQRRVKFTFDSRGERAGNRSTSRRQRPLVFVCVNGVVTRSEAELQLMRVPRSECTALL